MLAQAQECVWQKAVMGKNPDRSEFQYLNIKLDHLKNGLVAKLAAKVK